MIDFEKLREQLPDHIRNPNPEVYLTGNPLFLDFETTVISKGSALKDENDLVLACWTYNNVKYHCWGGCHNQGLLLKHANECDYIVAHNAKFELQWLARMGYDIGSKPVYCSMIAEYVLFGNQKTYWKLALDSIAQERLNVGKIHLISMMYKAGYCSRDIPESWLLRYCIRDVSLTQQVWEQQLSELVEKNLLAVFMTRMLTCIVLSDIEKNGMQLDPSRVVDKRAELEIAYAKAEAELEEMTGGINPNSPIQLADYLYDKLKFSERTKYGKELRTKSGRRLTDQATIELLKPTNKRQREFLRSYKENKALYNELTKYLRKFDDCCKDNDGRLNAEFNQTATKTHRLSSSGLDYKTQFQNFPRSYKPMFRARNPGWLVGEGDGAQLEFRVAAHLGRDEVALSDIRQKVDIHSYTAGIIGCSRQDAKADTFKPLYGGSSGTPRQVAYYEAFKLKYSGITEAQQAWINQVLESKEDCLITEWGMRYYFPGTKMQRSGYVTNTTSICNYPVQAFATAEIIPIALVYFWYYARALELAMLIVNTIHDSIITEMPPEEEEQFTEISRQCLIHEAGHYLRTVYGVDFVAPLGCGIKVASHWSEGEEKVYED